MRSTLHLLRGDALLVVILLAGQLELWALPSLDEPLREARLGTLPFVLASTVALGWRRRAPLASMCAVAASVALQGALVAPTVMLTEIAALLVAAYSLAAHADFRRAVAGAGVGFLSIASLAVATSDSPQGVASIALFLGAPWLAGRAVRAGRLYAARLEDLTIQLERERERSAGLAVAEERARIAREVHDILAHGIGVIALQAAGARRVLDRDPQRTREALASIEDASRQALAELRRLLEPLQPEPVDFLSGPRPGLDQTLQLVENARRAGQAVELRVEGDARALTPGLDLAAYRIVQEALTNALKHAPGAATHVVVRYDRATVELEVEDDGDGVLGPSVPGSGHGLIGMRERVALYGGKFEAGRRSSQGFRVYARLPVEEAPP